MLTFAVGELNMFLLQYLVYDTAASVSSVHSIRMEILPAKARKEKKSLKHRFHSQLKRSVC